MKYILSILLISIISIQSHSLEIVNLDEQVESQILGTTPVLTSGQDPEKALKQAKFLCGSIARTVETGIVVTQGDQSKNIGFIVNPPDFALGATAYTCTVLLLNN